MLTLKDIGDFLYSIDAVREKNGAGFNKLDWSLWPVVSQSDNTARQAVILAKYRRQITEKFGNDGFRIVVDNQPEIFIELTERGQIFARGYLGKKDFGKYLDLVKSAGCRFDSTNKGWSVQPGFDVEKFVKQSNELGFEVRISEEFGVAIEEQAEKIRKAAEERQKAASRVLVRARRDGSIEFSCGCFSEEFNKIFSNRSGILSGITEYEEGTHCRLTRSVRLAEEAIGKIKERMTGFEVVLDQSFLCAIKVQDAKDEADRTAIPEVSGIIDPSFSLFAHQNRAVKFLDQTGGNALIGAAMGCVDGDTIVTCNRAGKSFRITIKELHNKFHGGITRGSSWNKEIPTRIRSFYKGYLHSIEISNTYYSGVRSCIKLGFSDGKSIICTKEHLVLTNEGWLEAKDMLGKFAFTNGVRVCTSCFSSENLLTYKYAKHYGLCKECAKNIQYINKINKSKGALGTDGYRYIKCRYHPHSLDKPAGYLGVPEHRLVIEAKMNNVEYDYFVKVLREEKNNSFVFLEQNLHVHHINGNKLDNNICNLVVLDPIDHHRIHANIGHLPIFHPKLCECISVEEIGTKNVFDISVIDSENFVANGIVVHNSGKTPLTLAWVAKNNLRVIVVCPKVVRRTWCQEAEKFFPKFFGDKVLELKRVKTDKDLSSYRLVSVNYESLEKYTEAIVKGNFDVLVIDESHLIKNIKAKRSQQCIELSQKIKHHVLLSGTAIKNSREELFPQLSIVSPGKFNSVGDILSSTIGSFWHSISDCYLSMAKADVLKFLPPKIVSQVHQTVEDPVGLPESIEEISKFKVDCALSKVKSTIEYLENLIDNSDSKAIVFSDSIEVVKEIYEHFKEVAILHHGQLSDDRRELAKAQFQKEDDNHRIFVTTRQSLAVGATLTAASVVVFNDLPWTTADIEQASDRCHRIGQLKTVNVYWIVAENSDFDSNICEILYRKYLICKAVNEGKQITSTEREFMETAVGFADLIAASKGKEVAKRKKKNIEDLLKEFS